MFFNCSTCFERHTAHHQELKNCNCSLWFYIRLWLLAAVVAEFPLSHDGSRQPKTYVKPEAAITVFWFLMMSGVSLETCWAIDKQWNNKFYYTVASCWLFLYDLYYDARIHEHQVYKRMHSVESFVFFLIMRTYVEQLAQSGEVTKKKKPSHIPIADQNFGTNTFLPLFPKSAHKIFLRESVYSILYGQSVTFVLELECDGTLWLTFHTRKSICLVPVHTKVSMPLSRIHDFIYGYK